MSVVGRSGKKTDAMVVTIVELLARGTWCAKPAASSSAAFAADLEEISIAAGTCPTGAGMREHERSLLGPELGGIGDGVDDLGVELRGGADAEDVAEDDLHEAQLAVVGGHVEGLGLDVGGVHDFPAEVIFGELGVGHALLCDGLDGLGAVLALGDADAVEKGMLVKCAVW